MLRFSLATLMCVCLLIIACGEEPPEEFYEGTPEDSAAIVGLLADNAVLLKTEDMFDSTYIPATFGPIEFVVADSYFREDSTMIKQHVDSCALRLDIRNDSLDLWFAKDTTCTVYLTDTFNVSSLMHYDERQTGYYFWAGDTDKQLDTIIVNTTPGYATLPAFGVGKRLIFFEPRRDSTSPIIDTVTGDTAYPIIEPFDWILRRISYGLYYFPEAAPELPDIQRVILTDTAGVADTIRASSYDTLYTGHAMDRMKTLDSLLSFNSGDSLTVTIELSALGADAADCVFFAACSDSTRIQVTAVSNTLELVGDGITNLYFIAVLKDAYYYVHPEKTYQAAVWLVPVMIGGVK